MTGRWTDLATWRGPTVNHGGAMVEQRGLVLHIAEGSFEGTISWQKNASAQVSSHFVVDTDGTIAQVVEVDVTAWTQILGNGHWLSVENAGFAPHPLTAAQIEANAQLLARCHREFGVPLTIATSPSGRGLGHHSMGAESGVNWGHSDCPGPAIKAQKPAILARAIEIINGGNDMTLTDADANTVWSHRVPNMADRTQPDVSVQTALSQIWGTAVATAKSETAEAAQIVALTAAVQALATSGETVDVTALLAGVDTAVAKHTDAVLARLAAAEKASADLLAAP